MTNPVDIYRAFRDEVQTVIVLSNLWECVYIDIFNRSVTHRVGTVEEQKAYLNNVIKRLKGSLAIVHIQSHRVYTNVQLKERGMWEILYNKKKKWAL